MFHPGNLPFFSRPFLFFFLFSAVSGAPLTHNSVQDGVLRVSGGLQSKVRVSPVWGLGIIGVQKEGIGDEKIKIVIEITKYCIFI